MKRTDAQPLGGVILEYLRASGLETPLNEYRVIQSWSDAVGTELAAYTGGLRIFNQVLYVNVSSAAVRNELMMRRTELVKKLNASAGAQVITQIVLR